MDQAGQLRLGIPGNSTVINGPDGVVWYDREDRAPTVIAPLGLEVGRIDNRSFVRTGPTYTVGGLDQYNLGAFGRPVVIVRDVELDGCSIPDVSAYKWIFWL